MTTPTPPDDNESQQDFVARALASREQAHRDQDYIDADDVHAELERRLRMALKAKRP